MVKRERFGGSEEDVELKVSVDRISMLPSDLLGFILSLLTMKEAAATSILSRRWRNLWTLTPKLDLDGTKLLGREGYRYDELALEKERREYVRWVDRVVGCSAAESLAEFRVLFDLTKNHSTHIDGWLSFALSRKVERLELILTDRLSRVGRLYDECYSFPYRKWNFPDGFKLMKKLSTHYVSVSGEALEFFLGNCPLLEHLSVSNSGDLTALTIIRTFPWFKCLEISLCNNLTSLVIRDSDLVTLKYSGARLPHFQLLNAPLLTQLWIRGLVVMNMKHVVEMFWAVLPQLETFKIYFLCNPYWDETTTFLSAVRMHNLKLLVVNIGQLRRDADSDSLLPLINLISASPYLRRFVVDIELPGILSGREQHLFLLERGRGCGRPRKYLRVYPHLKEVEFVGYRGMNSQFELIMHFVENHVALENILVNPRCFNTSFDSAWDPIFKPEVEEEMLARAFAKKQLKKYVHPRINVKIL